MPIDRKYVASAVYHAMDAGARGVVLKFFYDAEHAEEGDAALEDAMGQGPTVLEAGLLRSDELPSNPLPERFIVKVPMDPADKPLGGNTAMIPIPRLAKKATAIGFTDVVSVASAPLLERYRGQYVKSLFTCCLELAIERQASFEPNRTIRIGAHQLAAGADWSIPVNVSAARELPSISFDDLVDGKVPAAELEDRVILIEYDGPQSPTVNTPRGKLGIHRAFDLMLDEVYVAAMKSRE